MKKKLGLSQLKAWESFIIRQSVVIKSIEKDLENQKDALPLHWYDVLLVINHSKNKKLRLNEIADKIVTSRSALTRSVEKLAKKGLLTKEKCGDDKRGQFASITESGKQALKKTWVYYRQAIQSHFGYFFNSTEAKNLERLLNKIPAPRLEE